MHSHDRTLIAKLGFSDKDKKNPRHDWACQYLMQQGVLAKLLSTKTGTLVAVTGFAPEYHITKGEGQYKTTIGFADLIAEAYVLKDESVQARVICPPFKNTTAEEEAAWIAWEAQAAEAPSQQVRFGYGGVILIEVKIEPTSIGDILRQMRLYSEYFQIKGQIPDFDRLHRGRVKKDFPGLLDDCPRHHNGFYGTSKCRCKGRSYYSMANARMPSLSALWQKVSRIVITDFALQAEEVDVLEKAGIMHAKLGQGFEQYVASREKLSEDEDTPNLEV
jgi:hypothetical protein